MDFAYVLNELPMFVVSLQVLIKLQTLLLDREVLPGMHLIPFLYLILKADCNFYMCLQEFLFLTHVDFCDIYMRLCCVFYVKVHNLYKHLIKY